MKLVVFDFDSTLMDGETIDILAQELNLGSQVASITNQAMTGQIDFYKSLKARAELLEGLTMQKVDNVCQSLPLMPGALETIKELKARNYTIACFSGGFRNATKPVCEKLGIDAEFSNFLVEENGILTGEVGGEMMYSQAKGDMILRLQNLLKVSREDTVVIGDGANDISMFKHASTSIAFCANEVLKKEATHIVEEKNLIKILEIIK